ncbi:MAG: GNAT family N-acetyltransferase [Lachnospiraceae bacterium]|nr:GNAT family N-acetyltransferase [Lachnospiraceae bacterium]
MQHKGTKILETDRLILRKFRIDDAEQMFHNWASDVEVTRFMPWMPHPDVDYTRKLVAEWIDKYSDSSYYNWIIEWKETGEVIGNISAEKQDKSIEAAEVGYCMSRTWWGQGIMPEALRAVIVYLIEEVGLSRVAATHDRNNAKSGRVMEKAGMKYEGTLRAAVRNNQGIGDKVCYAILKDDLSKSIKQRYHSSMSDEIILYFMRTILHLQKSGIENLPLVHFYKEPIKGFLDLAMELIIDGQPPEVAALILDTEYNVILQKGKLTSEAILSLRLIRELSWHIHYDEDYYGYLLMTDNLWGNKISEYASRTFYPNLPDKIKEKYGVCDLIKYIPQETLRLEDY